MPPKFQLYKDSAGKFRFRIVAENGQTVASSEAYEQYASSIKGIKSVKKNAGSQVEDLTINDRKVLNPKYQIYKDAANKFRFRLRASNGEIIAQSEGYETKESCKDGIQSVKRSADGKIDESLLLAVPPKVSPVPPQVGEKARSVKAEMVEAKLEKPEVKMPEPKVPEVAPPEIVVPELKTPELEKPDLQMPKVEVPEVAVPEVKAPEVRVPETEVPKATIPEAAKAEDEKVAIPELAMPETKQALPEIKESPEKLPPPSPEAEAPQETGKAKPKRVRGWL